MKRSPKEVVLLVLALIALVAAVWTFQRKPTPSAAPGATAETGDTKRNAKKNGDGDQGNAGGGPQGEAARNPFVAPGAQDQAPQKPVPAGDSQAPGAIPGQPAEQPGAAPEPQNDAPVPTLRLSGIVAGNPSVAVIYQDDERHFVREGDRIGDYRVQTIKRQEVVLVGGDRKLILNAGGRQ
jgi:hypothetical protein